MPDSEEEAEITMTNWKDGPTTGTKTADDGKAFPQVTDAVTAGAEETVGRFLSFLENDIARHPERLTVLDGSFFAKAAELTAGTDISDIDRPLAKEQGASD